MKLYVSKWRMVTPYSDVMIFSLYFSEVLQNIPKTFSGWKYIVLFIGLFVLLQKNVYDYILADEKVAPPHTNDNRYPDFVNFCHTGQCKRTGGCYNELVVAFFSTGGGVKGKKNLYQLTLLFIYKLAFILFVMTPGAQTTGNIAV